MPEKSGTYIRGDHSGMGFPGSSTGFVLAKHRAGSEYGNLGVVEIDLLTPLEGRLMICISMWVSAINCRY